MPETYLLFGPINSACFGSYKKFLCSHRSSRLLILEGRSYLDGSLYAEKYMESGMPLLLLKCIHESSYLYQSRIVCTNKIQYMRYYDGWSTLEKVCQRNCTSTWRGGILGVFGEIWITCSKKSSIKVAVKRACICNTFYPLSYCVPRSSLKPSENFSQHGMQNRLQLLQSIMSIARFSISN